LPQGYQIAREGLSQVLHSSLSRLAPPTKLTISEWADQERRLSPEASAEPGIWDTSRAEYQRGVMDAMSDPAIETVVFMSGAQVGKTEVLLNAIGFYICHQPSPILVLQPTLSMGQAFSKDRLAPMIRDTPGLVNKVMDARSRDSNNTALHKGFPGGHVSIVGANSAAGLASRPIRVVLADEIDRYPPSAGSEGDPVSLAKKRTATFHNRKLVLTSTPTIKGSSPIEAAYEASDQRRYFIACADCGEADHLKWANVRWPEDRPELAVYVCEHCGSAWDDVARRRALQKGEWLATAPFNGVAGFHLSGLYSPWTSLGDAAKEFLEAKKLPEQLRVWVNTYLGETWEDQGDQIDDTSIADRREDWGEDLQNEVVLLTCGVDVQDDRLELEVVGWGRDEETWSVDYAVIYGDPSSPVIWSELDDVLKRVYPHASGIDLPIRSTCIDSGGHYTQAVYNFVRSREGRRVWAIKGVGGEGKALVGRPSKNNIGKIRLFPVGVDTAKEQIYGRLRIVDPGPGYCHFPMERDEEYFRQLTGEKIVTKYSQGRAKRTWIKTRARNEALDVRVYALGAFALLNTNINRIAQRIENKRVSDPVKVDDEPVMGRPVRRRPSGGFVNSWRG
jgi:phage terminase large subunit GpA-like protein